MYTTRKQAFYDKISYRIHLLEISVKISVIAIQTVACPVETTGEYAMSNPVVNAMMLDAEGTLWLATNGGVNYMPRQSEWV